MAYLPGGSSPHTRGLHVEGEVRGERKGIIPAHAGFTLTAARASESVRDHPRTRGVYRSTQKVLAAYDGSSPHTRGLPRRKTRPWHIHGIIPAHAGFTCAILALTLNSGDHPRTRGVYAVQDRVAHWIAGSPPHTRGLLYHLIRKLGIIRIIPAHAGFTIYDNFAYTWRQDHPRTRGVYPTAPSTPRRRAGSSPHTRGLRTRELSRLAGGRIIPAHAGFTRPRRIPPPPSPDHPRTRGVYADQVRRRRDTPGSSPHTRGLQHLRPLHETAGRIIPAHAGFTIYDNFAYTWRQDHPRTRGVYM